MTNYFDPANTNTAKVALSVNNSVATATSSTMPPWGTAISLDSYNSGKRYIEFEMTDISKYIMFGICTSGHDNVDRLGMTDYSWAMFNYTTVSGRKYHNDVLTSNTDISFQNLDIVQIAVDIDNHKVWFGVNNVWVDSGDPANGTNPAYEDATITGYIYAGVTTRFDGNDLTMRVLLSEFTYTPPTGFSAWGSGTTPVEEGTPINKLNGVETNLISSMNGISLNTILKINNVNL